MQTAVAAPQQERAPAARNSSPGLGTEAREFFRHGSPRAIGFFAVALVVTRIVLWRWSFVDLFIVAGIIAVQPFVEWLLHVFLLHLKPKQLFGMRIDPLFAKRHRMHHRDPRDIPLVFVPLPVLAGLIAVLGAISWFAAPSMPLKATVFATTLALLFLYEWTHFLIHSPYVPRTAVFRLVWRKHILHHYKNEQYWFGVTNPLADCVLRTNPRKESVPTSPTARTLGVDDPTVLPGPSAA